MFGVKRFIIIPHKSRTDHVIVKFSLCLSKSLAARTIHVVCEQHEGSQPVPALAAILGDQDDVITVVKTV